MSNDSPSDVLCQSALSYARAGFPVFPLAGKLPIEQAGQPDVDGNLIEQGAGGFHRATTDEGKILRWFAHYGERITGIGTPTGIHTDHVTGQPNTKPFDVLDVDSGHGGFESLRTLLEASGELPAK